MSYEMQHSATDGLKDIHKCDSLNKRYTIRTRSTDILSQLPSIFCVQLPNSLTIANIKDAFGFKSEQTDQKFQILAL